MDKTRSVITGSGWWSWDGVQKRNCVMRDRDGQGERPTSFGLAYSAPRQRFTFTAETTHTRPVRFKQAGTAQRHSPPMTPTRWALQAVSRAVVFCQEELPVDSACPLRRSCYSDHRYRLLLFSSAGP